MMKFQVAEYFSIMRKRKWSSGIYEGYAVVLFIV
jgi:hypothetical protein